MTEYIYDTSRVETHPEQGFTGETVVRCRDCEYYKPWVLSRPENGGDCVLNKVEVDVWFDGFCAWGERKSE